MNNVESVKTTFRMSPTHTYRKEYKKDTYKIAGSLWGMLRQPRLLVEGILLVQKAFGCCKMDAWLIEVGACEDLCFEAFLRGKNTVTTNYFKIDVCKVA